MEDIKERVFELVMRNGPVIPVQVSKTVNTNILFASAMLSQLVSEKKVRFSNAKIGSTPVYYVKGQEGRLVMLYKYLGEKPRKAFDLLKEKNVLKDNSCEPWVRVALREIKDFAYSFTVDNETYWRWYLMNEEEAIKLVRPAKEKVVKPVKVQEIKTEKKPKSIKKREIQKKLGSVGDDFYSEIVVYFKKNGIKLIEEYVIKKGKELDFIVELESRIGVLRYFVKAKNKKRISENDLSLAYNQGKQNKLPVIFLSNGELSKRSENYIEKNMKGYLNFRRI